jgi:hypothetical protein
VVIYRLMWNPRLYVEASHCDIFYHISHIEPSLSSPVISGYIFAGHVQPHNLWRSIDNI